MKRQAISDILLQGNSVQLSQASQQTQLMCKLVEGMLRSDSHQFTAEDAANHDFFSLVFLPKSVEDQQMVDTILLEVCLPGQRKYPRTADSWHTVS